MRPRSIFQRLTEGVKIVADTIIRLFTDAELATVAVKNLRNQKMRRNLTLLGIVIGISSIVALLLLGTGLNNAITKQFESLGLNTIQIQAGEDFSSAVFSRMRTHDAELIERIPHVEHVIAFYEGSGVAKNKNSEASVFLIGVEPKDYPYLEKMGYVSLAEGRYLNENDATGLVVYQNFVDYAFDQPIGLRQNITINGKKFKIVGISKPTDVAFGATGITNMVYTSAEAMKTHFNEKNPTELIVNVSRKEKVPETAARIEKELERDHKEKDFTVNTMENFLAQVFSIIGAVQFFVLAIAAISLLVGGIGIMNTMFMAVTERTSEIGTMKAMGGTDALIRSLFLAEAGIIGFIGGVLGILVGYLLAMLVGVIADQSGFPLPISFEPGIILFALFFSLFVGILSGLAPAEKAIRLDPVEAIRYE